jgi:hypothetical protein
MAAEVGAVNIRIGASIQGLLDGMKRAAAAVRSTTFDINSKLADSYKRAGKEQSVFRGGLIKLGDELTSIGGKMALFGTLPSLYAAGQAYKDFAELEKLEKGLTRYGESIAKVREIAKLPNIGIFDGAKSLISLKAMKLNSDLATRSIKAFANAITDAGGSAIDLEPALINLRQFVATKHINQVDLRQLAARMPQTYDAFEAAFGTQDVEKLNQKMAKIGVQAFIDKFVTELEKIPKAGGGAATAMEQLSDSFTIFSASVGKSIEKSLDVSSTIKDLSELLDGASESFDKLDPAVQKNIVGMAGYALAIPVVISAIGGLIKLLPILATGFGTISWPITAIIGTIAAFTALGTIMPLITNKAAALTKEIDQIGASESKINPLIARYEELKAKADLTVQESVELKKIISEIANVVPDAAYEFDQYGNALQIDIKKTREFADEQRELLKVLKQTREATITQDNKLLEKKISTLQTDLNSGKNSAFIGDDSGGAIIGGDLSGREILEKRKELNEAQRQLAANMKTLYGNATGTPGKGALIGEYFADLSANTKKAGEAADDASEYYEKMSESAFKVWQIDLASKWKKEQDELKEAVKKYKELFGVTSNLNVERQKLSKPNPSKFGNSVQDGKDQAKAYGSALFDSRIGATQEQIPKATEKFYFGKDTRLQSVVNLKTSFGSGFDDDALKKYFDGFQQIGKETDSEYATRIDSIEKSTGRLKNIFRSSFSLDGMKSIFEGIPEIAGQKGADVSERIETVTDATSQLKEAFGSDFNLSDAKEFFGSLPKLATKSAEKYDEQVERIVDTSIRLSADLTNALKNAANEVAVGFGEMIGNLMTGAGGVEDFAKRVIGTLGSLLKDMGKSLIAAGTAGIALKLFAKNPYLALAAGIGLVAIGTATTNKINNQVGKATTKFAKGGFAYDEMTAIVGDNPNSRRDPEMIAPYSKVHDSIKKSIKESSAGGGAVFIPEVTLRGEDIRIAFNRASENNSALQGKKKWG